MASAQLSDEDIDALRRQGQAEGWTFTVSRNPATYYSFSQLCGAVEPPDWQRMGPFDPCTPSRDLPEYFDWRDRGGCTVVKNQSPCGSCWAHAAIGSVECYIKIAFGATQNLSEQWLISCTTAGTCNSGGWHTAAYNRLLCDCGPSTDDCGDCGAVLEADEPWQYGDGPCHCPYPHPYCIPGWYYVGDGGIPPVDNMKQAIRDHGPITACIHAGYSAFSSYSGGVFNNCHSGSIDHVIVLVGWDDNQGTEGVWFLRNSWGTGWGEDGGYMRIPYGCPTIGYAAAYIDYLTDDEYPPDPDPMTFAVQPEPCVYEPTTEIMMQATPASDQTPPITYKFEAALGGHSRTPEWAGGTWYFDADLTPNTECGYRIKAKDGLGYIGASSDWTYTATAIELPQDLVAGTITDESIQVYATDTFTNLTEGDSGLYFDVKLGETPIGNSGWIQVDHWTAYGLDLNTTYTFSVKARNRNSYPPDPVPVVKDFVTTGPGSCALMGDV
ncbi:MAG: hypothetical protein JXQ75_22045, partial [Phycisphaerae bacterium]|nr:hypothetical protein [Phycisphaerae bacterium]